jgi:diguanylate cyclase (GGDEF)-like protein/PAS domain S-box-containing protein
MWREQPLVLSRELNTPLHPESSGLRILYADDSLSVALPVIAYLKKFNYQVTHVTDGKQAVETFQASPPDLVLMDVVMPVMDGIEATRRIKAMTTDHWVPLIMLTGLKEKSDLIAGLQAGADDYLTKPVDPHELEARIRSMLRIIGIQRRLHGILDHAFDGIIATARDGTVQSFNQSAERLFGYPAHEVIGRSIIQLMPFLADGADNTAIADRLLATQDATGNPCKASGRRRNGTAFLMQLAVTEISQPEGSQYICLVRDISAEEAARLRIDFLAHHDHLTGLPNRASFSDQLDKACRRASESPSALLFIDLDGFKPVNDRLGHDAGDIALQIVAKRLTSALQKNDFVARLGGDEFVVLLADIHDGQDAAGVGQRLIDAIGLPMDIHGRICQLGASIGLTLITGLAPSPDGILSAADRGMYAAKRAGKNQVAMANSGSVG